MPVPLYEYHCEQCDGMFELLRPVREASDAQPCPVCNRDSSRMMPTQFNAYVMRGGMPRRIPDQGLFWSLKGQTTVPDTGKDLDDYVVPFQKDRRESTIVTDEAPVGAQEPKVRVRKKRTSATTDAATDDEG